MVQGGDGNDGKATALPRSGSFYRRFLIEPPTNGPTQLPVVRGNHIINDYGVHGLARSRKKLCDISHTSAS